MNVHAFILENYTKLEKIRMTRGEFSLYQAIARGEVKRSSVPDSNRSALVSKGWVQNGVGSDSNVYTVPVEPDSVRGMYLQVANEVDELWLGASSYYVALHIWSAPGCNRDEIAEATLLAPETVVYHISKLKRLGYVEVRIPDEKRKYTFTKADLV